MTVRKIATLTNLSPSTIYRALKNPEKAKKEVLDIIKSITQEPIQAQHIKTVYIVFPHSNQFYTQLILELTSLLLNKNIKVIPFITEENEEKELLFFKSLALSSKVCVLWSPTTKTVPIFLRKKRDRPFTIIFNRKFNQKYGDIELELDHYYASQSATETLIKHNNTKILFIGGDLSFSTSQDRAKGFLDTIAKNTHTEGEILTTNFHNWLSTYQAMKNIDIKKYDSIFCGNEIITYGVLKILKEKQYSIPQDIRLISFDYAPIFDALEISMVYFSPKYIANKITDIIYNYKTSYKDLHTYTFSHEYIQKGSEYKH